MPEKPARTRRVTVTFMLSGVDAEWTLELFRIFLEQELWSKNPNDEKLEPESYIEKLEGDEDEHDNGWTLVRE